MEAKYKSILLVDDDEIFLEVIQRIILKKVPTMEVHAFCNPEEALEFVTNEKVPDITLLDLNMPKLNGWDYIEELEKRRIKCNLYMLTSSINAKDKEKSLQYDLVQDYLNKPLNIEKLDGLLFG